MENADPQHPEVMHYFDPMRKQGGDNTDALYVGAPINGTDTYRVTGHRGSARYFSVTVVERGDTPWGGAVAATLFGDQIEVAPDGSFELWLSPDPQPGNWIKTTPETFRLTFRQFFADWENEKPMEARIDRLTGDGRPAADAGNGDRRTCRRGPLDRLVGDLLGGHDRQMEGPTQPIPFLSPARRQQDRRHAGRRAADRLLDPAARRGADHKGPPPQAQYWAVEFGNYWWETMDYRYRLANTNCHYAALEEDGELIVVVSHDDPGLPNWLDPSGHSEGYVTYRWMLADHYPVPQCRQVKRAELFDHLPEGVRRISREERAEQLAGRRRGIVSRFKW
ncbi:DUF1214 domain-containing protein [Rhizorhabdus histidinilytica]